MKNISELVKYISWNYGSIQRSVLAGRERVHLIRLTDGRGLLRTDEEMVELGLAEWR